MTNIDELKRLADRVHIANAKWWVNLNTGTPLTRNVGELMMLTVSELSEAMEGHRKSLPDDKLPHRKMFEVEVADAYIRALDVMGGMQLFADLPFTTFEKDPASVMWSGNVAEDLLGGVVQLTRCYLSASDREHFAFNLCLFLVWCEEFADHHSLALRDAFEEKMAYNAVRADHKTENRKLADGKKY